MGVDPPMPGIGSFQTIFFVSLHSLGMLVSLLMPSLVGPRHCGQLSAMADKVKISAAAQARRLRFTAGTSQKMRIQAGNLILL
jgi:hypothetical protein